ncbi:hypothetical protein DICPUDRAFT_159064 [Dictyostelium purpureum]|uniref:BEACH domain-containing protein n=1 Tax=Dictyostelium purpureum TaxID=5786 RepID=F1A370_DICPU|nr:uncharacterized protein DICPUDRAFT_159064 [Dictyostelium purpureum]EGC29360.1 hypothetical protein DICPUDRAFT_159064 [Dictyostelium purpureum]|eukprot:XP_003294114.1 hypothetical protein DICPUDRAFT_159064 [Dictyostelium purpureum]
MSHMPLRNINNNFNNNNNSNNGLNNINNNNNNNINKFKQYFNPNINNSVNNNIVNNNNNNNNNSNILKYLWNTYTQTVIYQDSLFNLVEFLQFFTQNYYQTTNSDLLFLSQGTLTDITRHISKHLIEEIGYNCTFLNQQQQTSPLLPNSNINLNKLPEYEIYQYLIGFSTAGEGPLLMSSLDILSRQSPNGIPISFLRFLITILVKILSLPFDILINVDLQNNSNTSNINNNSGGSSFGSFLINNNNNNNSSNNNNNDFSNFNGITNINSNNNNSSQEKDKKKYVNKSNFKPIESFFYLSPLPSSLSDIFRDDDININSNIKNSNNNNNNNPSTNPLSLSSTQIFSPYIEKTNIDNNSNKSNSNNDKNNNDKEKNNKGIPSSYEEVSSLVLLSYQILKIIENLIKDTEFLYELVTSDCLSQLQSIFPKVLVLSQSYLQQSQQQQQSSPFKIKSFSIIYQQLCQIFSQIMSKSCLSSDTIILIHSYKLIKYLLNIMDRQKDQQQLNSINMNLIIELSKIIIFSIKSSIGITRLLHEDFVKSNGYSMLLNAMIFVSEFGTLKNKVDFIQATTNLLFIGYQQHSLISSFSSTSSSSSASSNHVDTKANTKIFEIYLNVFSISTSEETKTELLKCIKGVFYTSLIEESSIPTSDAFTFNIMTSSSPSQNTNNNTTGAPLGNSTSAQTGLLSSSLSTNSRDNIIFEEVIDLDSSDNHLIFHQFQPFTILFSQFDSLNIQNRKMILDMMDVLLTKNRISITELKDYCNLFKSELPSTVLLVSQHLTELLSKGKVNCEVLGRDLGLVQKLMEFLVDPCTLRFYPILLNNKEELSLCYTLISGKHFHNSKYLVLYMIVTEILNLLLELLVPAQIQSMFVQDQGLKALYRLLSDEYLIQPALKVIASIAIGGLQLESKIIPDLMIELQTNGGGASNLDSKVLTMRKNILSTMCYIFHNNKNSKNSFRVSGGFIWSVTILEGISRFINGGNNNDNSGFHHHMSSSGSNLGGIHYHMSISGNSIDSIGIGKDKTSTSNEIFFFLKVLIDTLSAVMKNNPVNQDYFRREIQFSTLSTTLKACRYMEGVYATSLCDSLLNMAVSGSWPPSCEAHSLEDGSLLSLYSPITSFFPINSTLSKSFDINFNTKFIEKERLEQLSKINENEILDQQSPPKVISESPSRSPLTPAQALLLTKSPTRRGRSYTNDFYVDRSSILNLESIDNNDILKSPSMNSSLNLDLASDIRPTVQVLSTTSKLPEKSSLALAQERYICCQSCRDSLTIENPEIFKLIILLMSSEDDISMTETKSSCYIIKELIFLTSASLANQKRLSSLLIDIITHFKPLLLSNYNSFDSNNNDQPSNLIKKKLETTARLKPLLLDFIQTLAGHNLTLIEFRKYFELLKIKDQYPLDLLNLLLKISSNRENIPLYYAELSKHGLEYIDFPSWGERTWPPTKGIGISFWFRYSLPCLSINKSPISLLSIDGSIGNVNKNCEIQLILDCGILHYRINHFNGTSETYHFSDFKFEADQFYHVMLTHSPSTQIISSGSSLSLSATNHQHLHSGSNSTLGSSHGSHMSTKKSPVKLYVNGFLRGQILANYPKSNSMTLYVRLGGTNASTYNQDFFSANNSWHLGNSYIFEETPTDKEVFYLYLLGPNHFRGLKVDISLIDSIVPYLDRATKLHPFLIDHLLNPTIQHLYSLHEKIMYIFTAKCLYVTTHRITNKTESVTHTSAQPQLSSSLAGAIPMGDSNSQAFSISNSINLIRKGSINLENARSLERSNSLSSNMSTISINSSVAPGTPQKDISLSSTLNTDSIGQRDRTASMNSPLSLSSSVSVAGSGITSTNSVQPSFSVMSIAGSMALPQSPGKHNHGTGSSSFYQNQLGSLNNSLNNQMVLLLQSGLPIPLPSGVISQIGVREVIMNSGGVSVIIYLIAASNDKEYQRSGLKLLQSIIHNSQQNLKDMKEISGYLLVSYLIRKKNWVLDDQLLSILFSFVGIQSTRTSIHYIDGVVQDVLALKHFLLERSIWRRASIPDQKKLFESLEKLVNALHENHDFNIIKFRQAGAFETILKMCREEDLPLDLLPTLIKILHSIVHKPNKLKEDLQLILSWLLETIPRQQMLKRYNSFYNNNSSILNSGNPSSTFSRKRSSNKTLFLHLENQSNSLLPIVNNSFNSSNSNNNNNNSNNNETAISHDEFIRTSMLNLLLDILSKSDNQVIEDFHSICSIETIFGLLINESVTTRVMFLKIIDIFLHSNVISQQFIKMKGFHLLGHQLLSFKTSEQIFGVLFCILFGKPSNSDILEGVSMRIYFLSHLSDAEMKYPGAIISILIILCNSSDTTQHMIIKMIHNIFLQSDSFKTLLLENELIPRLVDILASNFQKRMNGTSVGSLFQSKDDDNWVAEEAILSLLKEISLHGAKSQDSSVLRDILVVLHLNNKMDYDYICCLQRRVLFDVIAFFNDNKTFGNIDSLASSFEKLCVLTIHTLSYQEKKDTTPAAPKKGFNKTISNITSTFSPKLNHPHHHRSQSTPVAHSNINSLPTTSTIISSDDNNSGTSNAPPSSSNEISSDPQSTEDSSTTDSDSPGSKSKNHYHNIKNLKNIPIWIKEGNLLDRDDFVKSLLKVLSNTKIPQTNTSYRNLFSTQYSARSLLCKFVYILLTFNEFSDTNLMVLQELSNMLATTPFTSPSMQSNSSISNNSTPMNFTPIMNNSGNHSELSPSETTSSTSLTPQTNSLAYSQQTNNQIPIINISNTDETSSPNLTSNLSSVLSELILEEDFILVLLHITYKFIQSNNFYPMEIQRTCFKLWISIIQNCNQVDVVKKAFDTTTTSLNTLASSQEPRDLLIRYQQVFVENEFKKWEEKFNQSKREWKLQYLETQKNKQSTINKNQDISKSTKKLSESLITLKSEYEKSNYQYMIENRKSKRFFQTQWKLLIKKITHEKGIWSINESILINDATALTTKKWKLDPTEGPHRMRMRLKQISDNTRNSHIPILAELSSPSTPNATPTTPPNITTPSPSETPFSTSPNQLNQLLTNQNSLDYSSFDNLKLGEKVDEVFKCSCISPFYQRDGELLICDQNVYFLDELLTTADRFRQHDDGINLLDGKINNNNNNSNTNRSNSSNISSIKPPHRGKHIIWSYEDIIEIHKRRHVLKNNAIEIFLGSGVPHKTYLFAFNKTTDRDTVYDLIMSKPLPNRVDYAAEVQGNILKMSITKKWQSGLISNFEYLMHLNTLAGRSFNDLTQYPIFPFILKDYTSEKLDLENPDSFRDFTKPMGAQDPERLQKFIAKYNYLLETNEKPYHYGSHYSNIGSVLHFLVRLQPFTSYFIEFQGGRFDVPDRAFHSIAQSWNLSSSISSSDVKELIPEFFYLPDFLVNSNKFNMGTKQDGVKVDDVLLPPWAHGDPRLFIKKHNDALESKYVSENLHHWIDLMFGYKQQGEAAAKAFNMFFPLTYEGAVDIDSIEDQLTRDATIAQIHSYGQTPKQIFTKPHPKKNWNKTIRVVQDCIFTKPEKLTSYTMFQYRSPIGSIAITNDSSPIHLAPQRILFYPDNNKSISWGHWDQNLRVNSIDTGKVLSIIEVLNDDIICGDITKNGRLFVTGGTAGTVKVWKRCNNDGTVMTRKERGDNLSLWSTLYGHTNSILCITVSQEFSIIVSGSKDSNCIIWDLNRLTFINSLQHENPVTSIQVSQTTNSIATFETCVNSSSNTEIETNNNFSYSGTLRLWNINGKLIEKKSFNNDRVNCMAFTSAIEGVNTNLLITGMQSGSIILWNAYNLQKIKVLHSKGAPITALAVSKDNSQLISGDVNGLIECWSSRSFDGYSSIVG